MPKFTPSVLVLALSISLTGCHTNKGVTGDTGSLAGIQSMASPKYTRQKKQKVSKIREMALKETALSLGAQAGLSWRAKIIDEALTKQTRNLDAIYDFNALILEHNVLPPVLLEGRNTLNLADTQNIRVSDRTYKVNKQAHFITTAPTWRQYLWMDYVQPEAPDMFLLPKNKIEKEIWCIYTAKGWKKGIEQANTILEESQARLKEDFSGMILYRKLLAMNMVSPPYVSHTDLGVTGDESEIRIDDRVLRITALPGLNVNSDQWKAAVAKDENTLEQLSHLEKTASQSKVIITNKTWQPVITPVN